MIYSQYKYGTTKQPPGILDACNPDQILDQAGERT